MKTKITISHVNDFISVAKEVFNASKVLKPLVAGSSIVAWIATIMSNTPNVVWAFMGIPILITGVGFARVINKYLKALKVRNTYDEATGFGTTYSNVTVAIAPNCKTAKFTQKRAVVCQRDGVQCYTYQFLPSGKYSEIKHNVGTYKSYDIGDTHEVKVEFQKPFKAQQKDIFILSATMNEVFTKENEEFYFSKYYKGTEAYKLEMIFPIKRFPSSYYAVLIENGKETRIDDLVSEHFERKKPSLVLDVPKLEDGQDVCLRFKW